MAGLPRSARRSTPRAAPSAGFGIRIAVTLMAVLAVVVFASTVGVLALG